MTLSAEAWNARVLRNAVNAAGLSVLFLAASQWRQLDWVHAWVYLALVALVATWKVNLPEVSGSISPAYVIGLIAMAQMGWAESVFVFAFGALVQTLWKTPPRRQAILKAAYNTNGATLACAVAYFGSRWLQHSAPGRPLLVMFVAAVLLHYLSSTLLLALSAGLSEGRPVMAVWSVCNFWVLPHYIVGATLAGAVVMMQRTPGWAALVVVIAVLAVLVSTYRTRVNSYRERA